MNVLKKSIWILGLGLVSGTCLPAFALNVGTGKDGYWRYEVVDIVASAGQSENADAFPARLTATVWQGKERQIAAGNLKEIVLKRQPDRTWKGYWPIPFNPVVGTYRIEAAWLQADGATRTAAGTFKVMARKPYTLPNGFAVVTDEGGRKGPYATAGFTPEEPKAARNMVRWAQYMGADAFWECIGQTQVWTKLKNKEFPWFKGYQNLVHHVGSACHEMGLKYGCWITSFVILGDGYRETGYSFTKGYDPKTNRIITTRFVSLGCEKRLRDMANLMKEFEASPDVDYIGLDYMRTDWGGYEFAEEFVRDMSVKIPPEWSGWSDDEKSLWLGQMIGAVRNPEVRARWEWWRAHKVCLVIRRLLEDVKPTKPVWVFSLGWLVGHQHGQDLAMMIDAGIGFNAPMFYHAEKPNYINMVNDWDKYLKRTHPAVVVGEIVDWKLLGKTLNPSGPQEHFDRQKMVIDHFLPATSGLGLFWHDMARSQYGYKGPYCTQEWVIAGAASFSELRVATGRIPYRLTLRPPRELVINRTADIDVEIVNNSGDSLNAVSAEMIPLPRLEILEAGPKTLRDLPAGTPKHFSLKCRTGQVYAGNGGYQMIAVKATLPPEESKDPLFAFAYVPVVVTPTPPKATPAAKDEPEETEERPEDEAPADAQKSKGRMLQARK